MDSERAFLERLGVDFGQRRSRDVLALYVKGLRCCEGTRSLPKIAAAVCSDPREAARLMERFNYQLNDRHSRSGRGWWAPSLMRKLAERTVGRLAPDRPRAFVLVAVFAPHLGRSVLRQRDVDDGTAQVVPSLLLVGYGPTGELEAQPIGWRLVFDLDTWDKAAFERAEVPEEFRHKDHVSVPAGNMLADLAAWRIPPLPIVASPSFAELRYSWLANGRRYVVEWKPPRIEATQAALIHPNAEPASSPDRRITTLRDEITQHHQFWRNVESCAAPSRYGPARQTNLTTKWRTTEIDIEVDGRAWCAHLPGVPSSQQVERALEYNALRENANPIYRRTLCNIGLDDYRGRTFVGWHAHRALVSAAHLLNREEAWNGA